MPDTDKMNAEIQTLHGRITAVDKETGQRLTRLEGRVDAMSTIPTKLDELNTTTIRMAASLESIEKWNKKLWGIVIIVALCGGGGTAAVLGLVKNEAKAQAPAETPDRR